jgi:hypothetical protein
MRGPALLSLLLLAGCYRLEDLVPAPGTTPQLVGGPVSASSSGAAPPVLVDLPIGIAAGDLLIASVYATGIGAVPPGWEVDASQLSVCSGGRLSQFHRRVVEGDAQVDLTQTVAPSLYSFVIVAYRNVAGLGPALEASRSAVQAPYDVALPPADTGAVAYLALLEMGGAATGWAISDGGRVLSVAGNLVAFDVPLGAQSPTQVTIRGGATSDCLITRAQVLEPGKP